MLKVEDQNGFTFDVLLSMNLLGVTLVLQLGTAVDTSLCGVEYSRFCLVKLSLVDNLCR